MNAAAPANCAAASRAPASRATVSHAPVSRATVEDIISTAPLVLRRTVRWADCDPAGVVFTPRFLDYVISAYECFVSLMLGAPLHGAKRALGVDFPARAVSLDFRSPVPLEGRIDIALRVSELRVRSYDLSLVATHVDETDAAGAGRLAFLARLTPVTVDPVTRAAVPLPAGLRAAIAAYAAAHPPHPETQA